MITEVKPMTSQEIIGAAKMVATTGFARWWEGITELLRLQALDIDDVCAHPQAYQSFWHWTARRACREFGSQADLNRFCVIAVSMMAHPTILSSSSRVEVRLSPVTTVYMPYATATVAKALIRRTERIF